MPLLWISNIIELKLFGINQYYYWRIFCQTHNYYNQYLITNYIKKILKMPHRKAYFGDVEYYHKRGWTQRYGSEKRID